MTVTLYNPRLAPKLWLTWLQSFNALPGTAQQLWRALLETRTGDELGLVIRAQKRGTPQSVGSLLQALSPKRMLQLCAVVSPEGAPRDPQIIQLERALLAQAKSPTAWR